LRDSFFVKGTTGLSDTETGGGPFARSIVSIGEEVIE